MTPLSIDKPIKCKIWDVRLNNYREAQAIILLLHDEEIRFIVQTDEGNLVKTGSIKFDFSDKPIENTSLT